MVSPSESDPLPELLAFIRQGRREVAVSLPGPVELCLVHRREIVHRLDRCARRMGWPPDPLRQPRGGRI